MTRCCRLRLNDVDCGWVEHHLCFYEHLVRDVRQFAPVDLVRMWFGRHGDPCHLSDAQGRWLLRLWKERHPGETVGGTISGILNYDTAWCLDLEEGVLGSERIPDPFKPAASEQNLARYRWAPERARRPWVRC